MTGRAWCRIAIAIGGSASIAANVLHARLDPDAPPAAAVAAALWPILLLVAIELLARVEWPSGWQWQVARFGGIGLVGAVAAGVSWIHMSGLLVAWGRGWFESTFGPVAIDGVMVMATAGYLASGRVGSPVESALPDSQPVGSPDRVVASDPTPRPRSTRPKTRPTTRPARRSLDELVAETRLLIAASDLPVDPPASRIREAIKCSQGNSFKVKAALTDATPELHLAQRKELT
ncbi:MAG: hypothetical protein ACRCYU_05210 [Nocardioides sp.]